MNYWLTNQWPTMTDGGPVRDAYGVFLPAAGSDPARRMRPGDRVLICEFQTRTTAVRRPNRCRLRRSDRWPSEPGLVVVAKVVTPPSNPADIPPLTIGRDDECWIRILDMRLPNYKGFVPHRQIERILGVKPGHRLGGTEDNPSGLYRLHRQQFVRLGRLFRTRQAAEPACNV